MFFYETTMECTKFGHAYPETKIKCFCKTEHDTTINKVDINSRTSKSIVLLPLCPYSRSVLEKLKAISSSLLMLLLHRHRLFLL